MSESVKSLSHSPAYASRKEDVGMVFIEQRASTPLGPRIIHANREFLRLSGYDAGSLIGSPLGLIYDRTKLGGLIENLPVIATSPSHFYMDRLLIRNGGSRRLCHWTIRPTRQDGETPGLFALTVQPVDRSNPRAGRPGSRLSQAGPESHVPCEVKSATTPPTPISAKAEITAPPKRDYEQCRAESLSLTVAGVAHDFKNALQTIKMNLELAALAATGGKVGLHIEEAQLALDDAEALARQMLAFTRGEGEKQRVIRVGDLIRRASRLCSAGSGIRCRLYLPDELRCVEGDPDQIYQVLHNLVINASQSMPNGGTVDIVAGNADLPLKNRFSMPAGHFTVVSVRDRGCGIPPQNLSRIFEPRFTTKKNGSGIGLASCLAIVTAHGGQIRVASEVGVGTEFLVFLPSTNREPEAPALPMASDARPLSTRPRSLPNGSGRVLVVEDEPGVARSTIAMLKQLGYEGWHASNGEEALSLYREHFESLEPIDLVIIDMTLPGGLSGEGVAREIYRIDPEARLVATSGYFEEGGTTLPPDSLFLALLPKPYGMDKLSEAMEVAAG